MAVSVPAGAFRYIAQNANAQKSTGPTTDLGKAAAARNAVLHGLTSKFETLDGEPPNRARDILRELITDIRPGDTHEWTLVKTMQRSMIGMIRCREHADAAAARRAADAANLRDEREIAELEEITEDFDFQPKLTMHRLLRTQAGIDFVANRIARLRDHWNNPWDAERMRLALNLSGIRAGEALDDAVGNRIAWLGVHHGWVARNASQMPEKKCGQAVYNYLEPLRGDRSETDYRYHINKITCDKPDAESFKTEVDTFLDGLDALVAQARARLAAERAERARQDTILAMQDLTAQGALLNRYESAHERSYQRAWRDLRQHRGIKGHEAFILVRTEFAPTLGPEEMAPWEPEQWEGPSTIQPATEPETAPTEPEPAPTEPEAAPCEPETAPEPDSGPTPSNPPIEPRYVCNERGDYASASSQSASAPAADPPPDDAR